MRWWVTKARSWPNNAKEARDRAAEEAVRAIHALRPLLSGQRFTAEEIVRRVAVALDAAQMIARLMEGQGAQTRP